jgi:hypothetical protein
MAEDRLSLCIPIDVARAFDSTVSQAQIGADTFQNTPDDDDYLASLIEDAEDEWRVQTDDTMQISRVGVSGQRTTFEQATYKISGHKLTKATFTGVTTEYLPDEDYIMLEQSNILPFDSSAGDAVYFYKGLDETGDGWEEITTDENDIWQILDYREGRFVFQPTRLREEYFDTFGSAFGSVPSALKHLRFAISYRYGALGGSRGRATSTELSAGLTDTETGTVSVADGARFPTGSDSNAIVVLIDREYLRVEPDPANDQMNIVERGVRGTTAASHDSGDRVQYTPPAIRKAVASRAGMQLIGSSQYQDWLPDTESSLDKGDVYDNLESVWTTTVDAMSG